MRACVRVAIRRLADARRLSCMHRNWFAPDTGLAIEWRVSMRSRCFSSSSSFSSTDPCLSLSSSVLRLSSSSSSCTTRSSSSWWAPRGDHANLPSGPFDLFFRTGMCLLSWDKISRWSSELCATRSARIYFIRASRLKPIRRLIAFHCARRS